MKRILVFLLILIVFTTLLCPAVLAAANVFVAVDGSLVKWTDAEPFIDENNRTLCPLRAVAEALGLNVDWDPVERVAIFSRVVERGSGDEWQKYTFSMYFPIDSSTVTCEELFEDAFATDEPVTWELEMDTAAIIRNDRTYAPVRYLAETFGFEVGWDAPTRTVLIHTPKDPSHVLYYNGCSFQAAYVIFDYSAGERYDELRSMELQSVRVNGEEAEFRVLSDEELTALAEWLTQAGYSAPVYAFCIFGDFAGEAEKPVDYALAWDILLTYADEEKEPSLETNSWTWSCTGEYSGYILEQDA